MSEAQDKYFENLRRKSGILPPEDEGFFGGIKKGFLNASVGALGGIGKTVEEFSGDETADAYGDKFGSGLRKWSEDTLRSNQQWKPASNGGWGEYIGNAIGNAAGSSAVLAPAIAADAMLGTKGAATFALCFGQSFGDNLQRNRELYGPADEAKNIGLAAAESAVDSFIEVALETLPMLGRTLKGMSYAGKREIVRDMFREAEKELGRSGAKKFFLGMAKNGAEEGAEEGLQYVNSWMWRALGGDKDNEFKLGELADNMAQGAIGGAAFGMIGGANDARIAGRRADRIRPEKINLPDFSAGNMTTQNKIAGITGPDGIPRNPDGTPAEPIDSETQKRLLGNPPEKTDGDEITESGIPKKIIDTSAQLTRMIADDLGIKLRYFDEEGVDPHIGKDYIQNGWFDKETNELWIDRRGTGRNPLQNMGHEFKHYLNKTTPELAEKFDALFQSGMTEEGRNELEKIAELYRNDKHRNPDANASEEFSADTFAQFWTDPDFWRNVAQKAETQERGMGEKLLSALQDFIKMVRKKLKKIGTPEAKVLFDNMGELRNEAVRIVAEVRRRNGHSTDTENVVGVKGNSAVQSIPLRELNIDPERFQFKSKADKVTGGDESNKIGGKWDLEKAGNLYVWEDRNGKKFVVNGHHRFDLARKNNVENVNAIIDREADGVTPEQARRNGILINIRDKQGDVRDYAEFVRRENMDENTAEKEGLLSRAKGRQGYTIGRYAGDTLFSAYRNREISDQSAALIADIARGDEAIETVGIREKNLKPEELRQLLNALNAMERPKTEQGDLFGFDESVLELEKSLSKQAAKHIREIRKTVNAARDAIKNPKTAHKLGVKVGKGAEKLLNHALKEQAEWDKWYLAGSGKRKILMDELGLNQNNDISQKEELPEKTDNTDQKSRQEFKRFEKKYRKTFGNLLSADNVKLMFREEGYNPHDEESGEFFHRKAAPLTGQLFDEYLKTRKGKGDGSVVFTGGGNGSGKSSVLGSAAIHADFVMDSTMVNRDVSRKSIQKVIDNGQKPVLAFAYRDPADAWFNGVQKRNKSSDGHIVTRDIFANTHSKAKENFIALVEEFGDKVEYIIQESLPGNTFREMTLDELKAKPKYTKDQILEIINGNKTTADEGSRGQNYEEVQRSNPEENGTAQGERYPLGNGKRTIETRKPDSRTDKTTPELPAGSENVRPQYNDERSMGGLDEKLQEGASNGSRQGNLESGNIERFSERYPAGNSGRTENGPDGRSDETVNREVSGASNANELLDKRKEPDLPNRRKETEKQYSLQRVPKNIADFRAMPAHPRPPKAKFSTVKELYEIYKKEYLGQTIRTASGHDITFKPGHFFRLIAGTPAEGKKGFIAKAKNAADAIAQIEEGKIGFGDIAGFQISRAENLPAFKDVITDADFWIREKENKFLFGKKYSDIKKADGFLAVTLEIEKEGKLGPVSFHPRKFSEFFFRGKEIHWNIANALDHANAPGDVSSRDKSSGLNDTIAPENEMSNGKIYSLSNHQQKNPIRENGNEKIRYQNQLDNRTYHTKSNEQLNKEAVERIANYGGIKNTIQMMMDGDLNFKSDVAQRVLQTVLNSDEFKALNNNEKEKIADVYIKSGTELGRALASRRLALLDMNDIHSMQAHVNALVAKLQKEKNLREIRNTIQKEFGIDIDNLPDSLVNNPHEFDRLLRRLASMKASKGDKLYEFWINSILSGPVTHTANILGNTANAVYELGVKRFTEAVINSVLHKKDSATFGEFREMTKAFNWKNAWEKAKTAFDLEVVTPDGKLESVRAAIGGNTGRIIRIPGRLLRAADEFAKALIVPAEAAAHAYREGKTMNLSEAELKQFVAEQLKNINSPSMEYGRQRALDLTFQEEPGVAIQTLMHWRDAGGIFGNILKFTLPFLKTPGNILRQGIRKSPLGVLNLAYETGKTALGKRKIDNEYIQHAAEQVLAWGTIAMIAGMDDDNDDGMPFLTGSSPAYGSAEQRFKANKVPPYSIRIGGTYYSYKRFEPLATGLAFIADGLDAYRKAKSGKEGTDVLKQMIRGVKQMIVEKSFLDSLGEINRIASDPERSGMTFLSNFASSWMPNVVRQTIGLFDNNVKDYKSRERGSEFFQDQFRVTTDRMFPWKAAPKIDYFGREIKKDSLEDAGPLGFLARLIPLQPISPDSSMNRAERLMWKYNQRHPENEFWPSVPAYYFSRNGKKGYFTGNDYQEFARESGQLALKQINNAFRHGLLNEQNPTERDIKLIRKIFTLARKEIREKMIRKGSFKTE